MALWLSSGFPTPMAAAALDLPTTLPLSLIFASGPTNLTPPVDLATLILSYIITGQNQLSLSTHFPPMCITLDYFTVTLCGKSRLSGQNLPEYAAYATISGTNWIHGAATYVKFHTEVQEWNDLHLYNNGWLMSWLWEQSKKLWSGREYPPGILAGWSDFMLVKPLFTRSQGHAIWDGDLTIN